MYSVEITYYSYSLLYNLYHWQCFVSVFPKDGSKNDEITYQLAELQRRHLRGLRGRRPPPPQRKRKKKERKRK